MGRFAQMAEEHWRLHLTADYERIADKAAFFADIEDVAMNQVEELAEHLRGQDPPDELFADRMGRFVRARGTAEEIVIREVVVIAPSPPAAEAPSDDSDTELEDAFAEFNRLRDQYYDDLYDANAARGENGEADS